MSGALPTPELPSARVGLALLWALGAAACAVRLRRDYARLRAARRGSEPVAGGPLLETCAERGAALRLRRPPRVAVTGSGNSPLLAGALSPVVLLPASLCRSCGAAELRLLLAHELAHVKRRDLAWNWLARP